MADVDREALPGEDKLCLGFLEDANPSLLTSSDFPNKVGGVPAWLALEDLPTVNELSCGLCGKPLVFLLQLYLPCSKMLHAYHRSLFVFVCRNGGCNKANDCSGGSMRVLRCQLPRRNKYYPFDHPMEADTTDEHKHKPSAGDYNKLCYVCSLPGEKHCGQCRRVNYCSRDHQASHWRDGHRQECAALASMPHDGSCLPHGGNTTKHSSVGFPEAEVEMEVLGSDEEDHNEDEDDDDDATELSPDDVQRQVDEAKKKFGATLVDETSEEGALEGRNANNKIRKHCSKGGGAAAALDDVEAMAAGDGDPAFTAFRARMEADPTQVIRYHRGGKPLYCSSDHRPSGRQIPRCPHCNQHRIFEFQVQPQLLSHLKVDEAEGSSLDWGVLLVYSCTCDFPRAYTPELIFKQDYAGQ